MVRATGQSPAARCAVAAVIAFCAGALDASGQGSQHAIRFTGGSAAGADRVVISIDDDGPGPDASTSADIGLGGFTVEFWIRGALAANVTANGGGDREYATQNWKQGNVVVDREIAGGAATAGAEFGIGIAGGFVRFGTGRGATAPFDSDHTLEGSTNVLDGTWHHVACVRDASDGKKRIFVDGALDHESGAVSFADLSYPGAGAGQSGHSPSLVLGDDAYDAGAPDFAGEIDEVRLWSRALTLSQILSRFDRVMPGPPSDLAAVYRFEEGVGASAADSGPHAGPAAQVVNGSPGNAEWTAYASNPASCAPIGFGLLPPGFQRTVITDQLTQPTALDFLPDGRLLIAERGGAIRLVVNGSLAAPPVIQLAVDTAQGERGVLGLAAHPQFASNGWFYVFHTSTEPRDRVSRFTLVGTAASPSSEVVIWQAPALASSFHHAGAIEFDATGRLLIATGDQLDSANAQDLGSAFGKLLRLNADGSIPSDNPFVGVAGARPEVFASGFRNPFRFSVDVDGTIFVGDVGGNTTGSQEEANRVASGQNHGWPSQEGANCYATDCSAYATPFWSYAHDDPDLYVLAPQGSITMGPRYRATRFPAAYHGNLFVADYANRSIRRLVFDAAGDVVADPVFLWPGLGRTIVDLEVGPDGALWYLAYGATYGGLPDQPGLLRIDWIGSSNAPPIAQAAATPLAGLAPLVIAFSSGGSSDPDALPTPLSYSWAFGDGQFSTQANPNHVYAVNGEYVAQLTVSDGALATTSDPLVVQVGGKPVPTIATPPAGKTYVAGEVIPFAGSAIDPEDGVLQASALSFEVLLVHAGHVHPFLGPLAGTAAGSFTAPATGHAPAETHFLIRLHATDSDGLESSVSVELFPDIATLAFATMPAGIPLELDGEPIASPHVEPSLDGFVHSVAAPAIFQSSGTPASTLAFRCWSDGGAAAHALTAPKGGKNLTAQYDVVTPQEVLLTVNAANRNAQFQPATGVVLASPSDANALCVGRDSTGGIETAFEFASPLPIGAVVVSATLELTGAGGGFGQPQCAIRAYDVAAAPAFVAGSPTPLTSAANLTSAVVTWAIPELSANEIAVSTDFAPVLAEVISRPDYVPGAHVGLVLDGAANVLTHHWFVRRFGTSDPPRLRVRYVLPNASGGACTPPCGFTTLGPGVKTADRLGLVGGGSPALGGVATVLVTGLGNAPAASLLVTTSAGNQPLLGGTLLLGLGGFFTVIPLPAIDGTAALPIPIATNPQYAGITLCFQALAGDPSQIAGVAFSNGLLFTICP